MYPSQEKDLVGVFNELEITFKQQWKEFEDDFDNKEVIPDEKNIPAYNLKGNDNYISEDEYEFFNELLSKHRGEYEFLLERLAFTQVVLLPIGLIKNLIKETRLLYICQTPDNIYVLPNSWKEKVKKRKQAVSRFGSSEIRTISLNEAYPDGIVTSYGKASKYKDRVKVTLPQAPENIHAEIVRVVNHIPKAYAPNICVIADPKSVGTELMLAEKKPAPPSPPRNLDPGIVIEIGELGALLTSTFFNMSALEFGFLDRVEKVTKKWRFRDFLMEYS